MGVVVGVGVKLAVLVGVAVVVGTGTGHMNTIRKITRTATSSPRRPG